MKVADLFKKTVFPDFRLIAGAEGVSREITSVSVIDSPDVFRWMRGGEFLIGSGYIFKEDPDSMAEFLRLVAGREIAALGIKIDRYHSQIPESCIKESDKLGLPLIEIPLKYRWIDINEIVYGWLLREREFGKNYSRPVLQDIFNENWDNHMLLAHLASSIRCPLAVRAPDLAINNYYEIDGTVLDSTEAEEILFLPALSEKEMPSCGAITIHVRETLLHGEKRYVSIYALKAQPPLEIALVLPPGEQYPSIKQERMTIRALGILRGNNFEAKLLNNALAAQRDQFLQNLCLGTYNNEEMVTQRAKELNINIPDETIVLLTCSTKDTYAPPLWRPPFSLSYKHANQWISIASSADYKSHYTDLLKTAKDEKLWIAVGSTVKSWENIKISYDEAKRALDWLRKFRPTPGIYRYGELAMHTLLNKLATLPEAKGLWKRYWAPVLYENSTRRAVPLGEVAKALISSDFNIKECAKSLHLHYNTVRNYVRELEGVLQIDLNNRLHRLAITLSYYVHILRDNTSWDI